MPFSFLWTSPWTGELLGLVYIGLSALVTVDVLLKKSDVRAALGWIAAVWLSPVFGALLYFLFGINRVTRRALKLRRRATLTGARPFAAAPPRDPEAILMDKASERITGSEPSAGNAIEILKGGDTAYPVMLAAIAGARHSVALASYIFRDDTTGRQFADAMIAAKARGVEVRVLLDSVGIGYFAPRIFYRMRRGGLAAARFLHTWVPWRMPFLNMRNHRKLLIVDGNLAFTGGMNISDQHSASRAAAAGQPYVEDIHFRIQGPGVAPIMEAFASDWAFITGEELDHDIWWPALAPAGEVSARAVRSGPDHDLYRIELIIGAALGLARKRVRIVTPYFLPDQRLQFAIAEAVLRGVTVEILLPQITDSIYMDWAMRGHLRFFRHVHADVYLSPQPFDHSKLVVMDGYWSLIGSSNWDARSLRLNFEFDLECYDRDLAGKLDAIIDAKLAGARKLDYDALGREAMILRLRNALVRLMMPYL